MPCIGNGASWHEVCLSRDVRPLSLWHAAQLAMVMHVAQNQGCGSCGQAGSGNRTSLCLAGVDDGRGLQNSRWELHDTLNQKLRLLRLARAIAAYMRRRGLLTGKVH